MNKLSHTSRRTFARSALATLAALPWLLPLSSAAQSTDWPTRPVTWVNPFAAGSAVDVPSRWHH